MFIQMMLALYFFISFDVVNHIILSKPVVAMHVKLDSLYVFTQDETVIIDTAGKIVRRCRLEKDIDAVYSFGKDFYYTSFKRYAVGKFITCADMRELELGDAPGITLNVRKVRKIMYDYQNFTPYFLENSVWMWSNKKRLYRIPLSSFQVEDSLILEDSVNFITMNERFLIKTFDSGVSILDRMSQNVCFLPLQGIAYMPVSIDSFVFLITQDSCLVFNLNDCTLIKRIQESGVNLIKKYCDYFLFFKYNPFDSTNAGIVILDRDFKVVTAYKLKIYPPFSSCVYRDTLILGSGCKVYWIRLGDGDVVDSLALAFSKKKVSFLEKIISSITSTHLLQQTVVSQICRFDSFVVVSGGREVYLIKH